MPDVSALAANAQRLMDEHQPKQISDPDPPEVRAALVELTDAIEASGVDRRDAEYAVTQWMIERDKTIEQCVAEQQTDEARAMRKP